ncbi:hypothetical protein DRO61_00885 [Candidatus Bathyarchaeota archaeon]|nr:MAG: hypothetical protein DRO61_00885 [Candidatus Bathyarchaeota archaeon]
MSWGSNTLGVLESKIGKLYKEELIKGKNSINDVEPKMFAYTNDRSFISETQPMKALKINKHAKFIYTSSMVKIVPGDKIKVEEYPRLLKVKDVILDHSVGEFGVASFPDIELYLPKLVELQ